jgi:hypothetical protein
MAIALLGKGAARRPRPLELLDQPNPLSRERWSETWEADLALDSALVLCKIAKARLVQMGGIRCLNRLHSLTDHPASDLA